MIKPKGKHVISKSSKSRLQTIFIKPVPVVPCYIIQAEPMAIEQKNRNIETQENPPMTQSDNHRRPPEDAKQPAAAWGTWEELLLAYAVNRYGTTSWDSISSELRKRTSAPIHLTPHHCQHKYTQLKRRFNHNDATATAAVPWLEELRKLRVLELQRQLDNYDLYISSLQSKVKKLTEEAEKTTNKNSDLGHRNVQSGSEKAMNETPEPVVSGDDDSGQSVNGSNGNVEAGVKLNGATPVGTGDEKPESAAVREGDSCNGGPEGGEPVKSGPDGEASESIAESKSEGKNSDVQSSAWKEGNGRVPRGSSKEDRSTDSIPVRSLPLVEFLRKVQKLGSAVFERRLDRQEKLRYKNLIKQHIDYSTLQSRLKEGWYSDGNDKFFRDLLLLVNNTRIFFPKQSPQSTAAVDLRQLILKEMISKKKQIISDSKPNVPPKRSADPPDSLLLKPKLTVPIVVCRKRSSITAKAAAGSSSGEKEQTDSRNTEKLVEENPKKSTDSSPLITKRKGKSPVREASDPKPEKKKKLTEAEEKKQSAAMFLNRMKRSSDPSEGGASENDSRGEQKKSGGNKGGGGGGVSGGDGKKDQAGKKSSCGRKVKEQSSPEKRSVGRPPKRAAAPPSLAAVSGKRNREPVDTETLGVKQTKKRSKR